MKWYPTPRYGPEEVLDPENQCADKVFVFLDFFHSNFMSQDDYVAPTKFGSLDKESHSQFYTVNLWIKFKGVLNLNPEFLCIEGQPKYFIYSL